MNKIYPALIILVIILCSVAVNADDTVVARVNSVPISSGDLEMAVDQMLPRYTFHGGVSEETRNEFRQKALEQIINAELEYQDAVSRGLRPDKKLVKAEMKKIREGFKSTKEYKAALANSSITENDLQARVEKNVLIQTVITKTVTEPAQMTEVALKEYYDKNISKFKQPESVKLSEISTKDENKARDIRARIKAGEDFGDVAARTSEDDYRIKGGDIGYIHRGRILPEVEDEAFKLKVGEVGGPIKAGEYWYIIRVEDKKPAHQLSYGEARDKLKNDLETKRAAELKAKWISDLRAKAKIEVFLKTP